VWSESVGGISLIVGGIIGGGIATTTPIPFAVGAASVRVPMITGMNLSGPSICTNAAVVGSIGDVWFGTVNPAVVIQRTADNLTTTVATVATPECFSQTSSTFRIEQNEFLSGSQGILGTPGPTFWASSITGTTSQPLIMEPNGAVAAAGTVYINPGQGNTLTNTTEQVVELVMPDAVNIIKMCISMTTSNASGGNYVATVRKNEAATALALTVALSTGIGIQCITSTVSYVGGDRFSVQIVNNNGAAATGAISSITLDARPTAANMTALIIYPKSGLALSASQTRFTSAYYNKALATTDALQAAPIPRAGTIRNLYCLQQTAPTNNATFTPYKQGVATALVATATAGAGANAVFSDTAHSAVFARDNWTSMEIITLGGTQVVSPGCIAGFYTT